jgi:2-haloacid dehalogenase
MLPTIVFDVNETLLDLSPVGAWFGTTFGDSTLADVWFDEMLRLSFVSSVTNRYVPFTELAGHALMTTVGFNAPLSAMSEIRDILTTLPPHSDVEPGLAVLAGAGLKLAALTNSPLAAAETQLTNAGISDWFDEIMSVEMVQRFKPHRSVYVAAAQQLAIEPSSMVMVAAHDWDVAGAIAIGCKGVFITRGTRTCSSAFPNPTLTAIDITDAAERIRSAFRVA